MALYLLIFILAFAVLARSSDILVRALIGLSRFFRFSEFAVASIFMSMATTIPEFFVGISSAINEIPLFSLGDILGANFINITLLLGIVAFFGKGLRVESKISRRNFLFIFGLAFLPLILAGDGAISRIDGIILILAFIFYIVRLKRDQEYFSKTINHLKQKALFDTAVFRHLAFFALGVTLLLLSALAIVWTGKNIAAGIGFPPLFFGLIFLSLGTTLPELAFGVRAKILGHGSMAVGNALGSIAFNSTWILGIVSLICPIQITFSGNLISIIIFLFLGLLCFNVFVYSKSLISKKEGLFLLFLYGSFLITEFLIHIF